MEHPQQIIIKSKDGDDEVEISYITGNPAKSTRKRNIGLLPALKEETPNILKMFVPGNVSVMQTVKAEEGTLLERWDDCNIDRIEFHDDTPAAVYFTFKRYSGEWTG